MNIVPGSNYNTQFTCSCCGVVRVGAAAMVELTGMKKEFSNGQSQWLAYLPLGWNMTMENSIVGATLTDFVQEK